MRRIALADMPASDADHRLDEGAAHYVTRVLRLRDGDRVEALAPAGAGVWRGVLRWRDGWPWLAERELIEVQLGAALVLVPALIKGTRWDGILEKATELGATAVRPFNAERSVVHVPAQKIDDRVQRWQRICDGAARQCGRVAPIAVHGPAALRDVIGADVGATVLFCDEKSAATPWPQLGPDEAVVVVIGPEGGITDGERRLLVAAGAVPVGLGSFVLRAETAAATALGAVRLQRDGLL